jgi:hypothetical protein
MVIIGDILLAISKLPDAVTFMQRVAEVEWVETARPI